MEIAEKFVSYHTQCHVFDFFFGIWDNFLLFEDDESLIRKVSYVLKILKGWESFVIAFSSTVRQVKR